MPGGTMRFAGNRMTRTGCSAGGRSTRHAGLEKNAPLCCAAALLSRQQKGNLRVKKGQERVGRPCSRGRLLGMGLNEV